MMVLIMANINYLVILICSTVFLLSSFVSSQQKSKNLKVSTTSTFIITSTTTTSDTTPPLTTLTSATEARATIEVAKVSVPHNGTSLVDDSRPSRHIIRSKSVEWVIISLTSTVSLREKAYKNAIREISGAETNGMKADLAWAHTCFTLGYNNTNGSCQSEPEVIGLAPNITICRSYFKFGCQYQLNQDLCVAAVDEVMKNINFNCDFNINGDSELMSVQCCMACKSGINTGMSKDKYGMHSDDSLPSFVQEKCCNIFLNQNASDSTTESIKPGSLNDVIADLEDRFSNSGTNKLEIDSSTVPETSTLPTNTTTATPTTTESTTAPSTTTTVATTTATTTELTTMASTSTTATPPTTATVATSTIEMGDYLDYIDYTD